MGLEGNTVADAGSKSGGLWGDFTVVFIGFLIV